MLFEDQRATLCCLALHKHARTQKKQVQLLEDEGGRFHLRNLSAHRVATEEEALNLVCCGVL